MSQTQNILLHLFLVFESILAHNLRSKTSCFAIVSHERNYSITSVTWFTQESYTHDKAIILYKNIVEGSRFLKSYDSLCP